MKNFLLTISLLLGLLSFGQTPTKQEFRKAQGDWIVSFGINALGNLGTRNPAERLGDFSMKNPFIVGIEYRWLDVLSLEQDIILNGYDEGEFIDDGVLSDKIFYFSTNTNVKFYFSDYLYDANWVDLYVGTGLGFFTLNESNASFNLLAGVHFWVNKSKTFGIRLQTAGKFAFNHSQREFANNHMIHSLQALYRF